MSEITDSTKNSGATSGDASFSPSVKPEETKPAGTFAILALKIAAWFNLVVSTLGSFYIFREFGVRLIAEEGFLDYAEKVVNPFGITLSIAIFLQGIFGCIFFLVIASIAENIVAIRSYCADLKFFGSRDRLQ